MDNKDQNGNIRDIDKARKTYYQSYYGSQSSQLGPVFSDPEEQFLKDMLRSNCKYQENKNLKDIFIINKEAKDAKSNDQAIGTAFKNYLEAHPRSAKNQDFFIQEFKKNWHQGGLAEYLRSRVTFYSEMAILGTTLQKQVEFTEYGILIQDRMHCDYQNYQDVKVEKHPIAEIRSNDAVFINEVYYFAPYEVTEDNLNEIKKNNKQAYEKIINYEYPVFSKFTEEELVSLRTKIISGAKYLLPINDDKIPIPAAFKGSKFALLFDNESDLTTLINAKFSYKEIVEIREYLIKQRLLVGISDKIVLDQIPDEELKKL